MKSKKHKKEKKKKQKKEKRRQKNDSSSEESSEPEMEWVESTPSSSSSYQPPKEASPDPVPIPESHQDSPTTTEKEDNWLESPFLRGTSLADIRKQKNAEKEKEREDKRNLADADYSARELNPYWKDGGTGMPEERGASTSAQKRRVGHGVDGGVSWLRKSYQRAVEQAKESGRPVDEVVAERWGSVEAYEKLLAEAKGESRGHSESRGPRGPPPGWKKRRDDGDDDRRRNDGRRDGRGDDGRDRKDDRGRRDREDRSDERDKERRSYSDSRRDSSGRGFKRPGDRDDDDGGRSRFKRPDDDDDRDSMRSRFKRPGEEDNDSMRSKFKRPEDDDRDSMRSRFKRPDDEDSRSNRNDRDRTRSSYYDKESSRDHKSDGSSRWRKTAFKKPGDDEDSYSRSSSSRTIPPASSSSSSGGWRKPGFKRPGNDVDDARSASSSGGWRKSRDERLDSDDIYPSGGDATSRNRIPTSFSSSSSSSRAPSSSSSKRRERRRSYSDDENSDDVESSSSSSDTGGEDESGGDDKKEEEERRSPSPVKILSDTEMNQLGAKLIKAEIMGNETLVEKLKAEIEAARQARIAHKTKQLERKEKKEKEPEKKSKQRSSEGSEEVILTRTDHSGQSWPLAEQTAPSTGGKKIRKKKIVTHDKEGERERYFADDDDMDLETMVRREKMGSTDDHNRLLNKVASKKLAQLDSEFNTLDEMFVTGAAHAESKSKIEERERSKAIASHQKTMAKLSKCPFCLESEEMKKHLIVALGLKVYLCVPQTRCISDGQCYIVPMQHAVASTALDEDVWAEIQVFRKGLTRMFEDHEMDVAFLETCMNPKKQRHMCIECLPIPRELGEMAPIYFKKALQECESEWNQQNKKVIDTRKKDIRKSVPRGFPYFSVDFGLDGGFAHVIEDELVFPHYFGKEVIGGLLDVEPRLWRHPPKENFQDQSKRVLELSQWWKPFDWTKKIDREKS